MQDAEIVDTNNMWYHLELVEYLLRLAVVVVVERKGWS